MSEQVAWARTESAKSAANHMMQTSMQINIHAKDDSDRLLAQEVWNFAERLHKLADKK